MIGKDDVRAFLSRFFLKFDIWGIFFLDREKNNEALKRLGITPSMRNTIIRSIEVDDYIETIENIIGNFGDLWVFGKDYDDNAIYIKVALGPPNSNTVCISFHLAEHPLKYAFK